LKTRVNRVRHRFILKKCGIRIGTRVVPISVNLGPEREQRHQRKLEPFHDALQYGKIYEQAIIDPRCSQRVQATIEIEHLPTELPPQAQKAMYAVERLVRIQVL